MADDHAASPFPFPFTDPPELYSQLARLRQEEPVSRVVLPSGHHAWLVTRHQDVRQVLSDQRFSSAGTDMPGLPSLTSVPSKPPDVVHMRHSDPPDHARLRKLVALAFSAHQVERLRPLVQQVVDRLLDEMAKAGAPADLVSAVTAPLPHLVMCAAMGLPEEDVDPILALIATATGAGPADEIVEAQRQMRDYIARAMDERRASPGDDLLSALVEARDEQGALSEPELIGLGIAIVFIGHTTQTSLVTAAVENLLRHPGQWARLRRHPESVPVAAEEMLRWHLVQKDGHLRIATEDITLSGVTMRAGDPVVVSVNAANRDPAVFADPDRLDLGRPENPHLAFGAGIHRCLARHLVRTEFQVALSSLLSRFPELRLAAAEPDVVWKDAPRLHGMAALPVAW
ncbi:cytochrome P450 [Streptomyces sannanensis]|uniref:Cytochrome P450 n=1 Tax=Streptomyces sannanensis TaxID=285536 RepID=A0ABP6S6Q9_9ACTN